MATKSKVFLESHGRDHAAPGHGPTHRRHDYPEERIPTISWTPTFSGAFGSEHFASSRGRSRFVFYVNKAADPLSTEFELTAYEMRDQSLGGRRLRLKATGLGTIGLAKAAAEDELRSIRIAANGGLRK